LQQNRFSLSLWAEDLYSLVHNVRSIVVMPNCYQRISFALFLIVSTIILAACDQYSNSRSAPDRSQGSLAQAQQYVNDRDYDAALVVVKNLVAAEPDDAQLRWLLGQIYLEIEDGASAEKELRRAQSLGTEQDSFLPALARALLLQNKFDEVLALELGSLQSVESSAELAASRAFALAASDRSDEASVQVGAALAAAPKSHWVRLIHGRLLLAEQSFKDAKFVLQDLLVDDPSNGIAWGLLGKAFAADKAYPAAEAAYTKAIENRSNTTAALFQRGLARFAQGDTQGAGEDAAELLELAPKAFPANYLLGLVHFSREEYKQAAEALESAYSANNQHFRTIALLAGAQFELGNRNRAWEMSERALRIYPGFVPIRKILAALYLEEGKAKEAEELVRQIVFEYPRDRYAIGLLASALFRQGRAEEAADFLADLVDDKNTDPIAYANVGTALMSAGRTEAGVQSLLTAGEIAPSDERINTLVVKSLLEADLVDEALAAAMQFAEHKQNDPAASNLMGISLLRKNRADKAEQAFLRTLSLRSGDPTASEKLALIAARRGELASARDYLERALKVDPDNARLLYRLAELELWQGGVAPSKELLERSVASRPAAVAPRVALARMSIFENEPERALDLLGSLGDTNPEVLLTRGLAFLQLSRLSEARDALESLAKIQPGNSEVHFLLARIFAEQGDQDALMDALERVGELAPDSVLAGLVRARLLIVEQRFDEAETLLDSLAAKTESGVTLGTRLFLERARGNRSRELDVARQLFARLPSRTSMFALVGALVRNGETSEAEQHLVAWLQEHPGDVSAGMLLTELYLISQRENDALAVLERLVAEHPDDIRVLNNLAWYTRLSNPGKSLAYAERAYKLAPESPRVLDTYAEALARNGQKDSALRFIDLAIDYAGSNAALKLRRAVILDVLGDREGAIAEVKTLISGGMPNHLDERARALLRGWGG
jgi:putative PEP-CTERM system TPR-repeat lipoprotein